MDGHKLHSTFYLTPAVHPGVHHEGGSLAARRNRSQARRNTGGGAAGLPGWAWLVMGIMATLVLLAALVLSGVISSPKFASGNPDGFFRPQPNPDAEPAPVDAEGEAIVPEGIADRGQEARPRAASAGDAPSADDGPEYDFYTLLPGKEVPMTEAEIAATAQAETRRAEQARAAQVAASTPAPTPLPAPVRDDATAATADPTPRPSAATPHATATTADASARPPASTSTAAASTGAAAPTAAPIGTDTRYLLQAGAFQASGQAEELKAKIAMLGLGARVESAQIQGKTVYRVRMGPYGTASDLSDAKQKLAASGLPGMAIKVD